MNSYRTTGENNDNFSMKSNQAFEDQVSLRSLPMTQHSQQLSVHSSSQAQHLNPPRSMSPVSSMSGDELSTGHGGRRSQRRRVLDKQVMLSNNSDGSGMVPISGHSVPENFKKSRPKKS